MMQKENLFYLKFSKKIIIRTFQSAAWISKLIEREICDLATLCPPRFYYLKSKRKRKPF